MRKFLSVSHCHALFNCLEMRYLNVPYDMNTVTMFILSLIYSDQENRHRVPNGKKKTTAGDLRKSLRNKGLQNSTITSHSEIEFCSFYY